MIPSPIDHARRSLDRVAARDADVRAWAHLDENQVLTRAQELAGRSEQSPLHGRTIGLKDIIETADQPTAYGSSIWVDHRPDDDATAVAMLKDAGLNVMGKTTTTEFATYQPTPTRNPHGLDHTPGGSSSGSAAAVGDGQVDLALGTQTAGSVNRPGSFCGTYTLKPTYHRWPFTGVLPVALTFDTLGGFARDPRDLSALDAILAGPVGARAARPRRELPERPTFGLLSTPWDDLAQPEALTALRDAAAAIDGAVGSVRPYAVPDELLALQSAHADIQNYEAAFNLRDRIAPDPSAISDLLREHLAAGSALTADEVQERLRVLRAAREFVARALGEVDLLLCLAAPGEAPDLSSTGNPAYNRLSSTSGVPAAGIPFAKGPAGLPMGLQLMSPAHTDQALMELVTRVAETLGLPTPTHLPN